MLVVKSAAGTLLAALFLAITTPTLLFQDAGPGKADDVAELLPEETLAFVEMVKAPRLLKDWREYVGSVTTAEGKEKLCAVIEEWFTKTLEIVPERLLKDLKEGLPSIQRIAVALTGAPRGGVPWMLIATSSDGAFFKKLVEEDLKVFAAEEKAHQGVKIFAIRKMGDLKSPEPVFVACLGTRLLATTSWPTLAAALDRAAGKGAGGDLRKNRLYAQFSPASDDPALRAFTRYDWGEYAKSFSGPFGNSRLSQHSMDEADAVFEIRKMPGAVFEAAFRPGQVSSRLRFPVDPPCRLYDALRQPPGPKDLLGNLPTGTAGSAHHNLKGGTELWASIEQFVHRFQEVHRKGSTDEEGRDYLEQFEEEMKNRLGMTPKEMAASIGNEVLVAMVDHEGLASPDLLPTGFLLLVRTPDAAKAKERVEAMAEKIGGFTASTEGKMSLWAAGGPPGSSPCFGLQDTVFALGFQDTIVKAALGAKPEDSGATARLPKDAASASGLLGLRPQGVLDMVLKFAGEEKPEPVKQLKFEDWSFTLWRTEKDCAEIIAQDFGFGAVVQGTLTMMPLAMLAIFSIRMEHMGPGGMSVPQPPVESKPEPPALAAEELARRVADGVVRLRSEDVAVREKATGDLGSLGRQAVPLLVPAYREEKDAEAKARLRRLLLDHKAWDALPELLDAKAEAFFEEVRGALSNQDPERWGSGYATWNDVDDREDSWAMEPMFVNEEFLAALHHHDLLSIPAGMKRYAERLQKAEVKPEHGRQLAAVLAFHDSSAAAEPILAMLAASTDGETKAFLTMALGRSDDPKAREAIFKAFEAAPRGVRRASFLAAERMRDPEVVSRLFERLKDKDFETRWNAGYTIGALTGGKIRINAFLPDAEFEAQIQAGKKWWDDNKAGFQLRAASFKQP